MESMQSINTVEYPTLTCKSRCAREASPSIIFSTDTWNFSRLQEIRMHALVSLSLSLSLSLSSTCFQSLQIVWMQMISDVLPNQIRGRIYHVSECPTLRPMPRNNIIEPWHETMRCVGSAKPQISLCICTVWSEPLLVAWIFYEC